MLYIADSCICLSLYDIFSIKRLNDWKTKSPQDVVMDRYISLARSSIKNMVLGVVSRSFIVKFLKLKNWLQLFAPIHRATTALAMICGSLSNPLGNLLCNRGHSRAAESSHRTSQASQYLMVLAQHSFQRFDDVLHGVLLLRLVLAAMVRQVAFAYVFGKMIFSLEDFAFAVSLTDCAFVAFGTVFELMP